jgi:NAD(P)-dependent dehydrogenase (short-subunit alcohol dehydrogenase family)
VLDLSIETWKALFDGNFFGAVLGAKTCLPAMIANGGGTVVVVSSIAGWMAEQQLIAYACTKATLIELAKSIAIDHARDGIRANVVAPGTTDTPSFRQGLESSGNPEEWREIRSRRNPLGRILTADEVASAVWFLSTEESSGMTGSVVTVDAGLTACYDFRGPDEPNYR